ncbi:MAG: molybdopterin biosynthesis protein [Lachnospiraceae bacterium]
MEHLMENKASRHIYIDNIPLDQAYERYKSAFRLTEEVQCIDVRMSLGRITAGAIKAPISSPHYHSAAMDGIVLQSEVTESANERNPVFLKEGEDFAYINTGYPIPDRYNAVIMIEDVIPVENGIVKILEPAHSWQHIRLVGEDIAAGEMILPSHHKIRALDIGALLSGGVEEIEVIKKLIVGIIPTGNEVTRDTRNLKKGQIIDSNSGMFHGLIEECGAVPKIYDLIPDDPTSLKAAVMTALQECDMLIINAGSSAGSKDYTVDVISDLGTVVVHGIAIKPGKPTILGVINEKPVLGIPGYPVSAYFSFHIFAEKILADHYKSDRSLQELEIMLSKRIVSSLKHEEYVRMTLGQIEGRWIGTPLQRGAGNTSSLVRADAVLVIPRNIEGYEAGELLLVQLLKPVSEIRKRTVLIGSHDMMLDCIGDMIPITSAHTGSMGGIMAIRKKECHIAPIHLIDEDTGNYNEKWIAKYFPNRDVSIIQGVQRIQGLILSKGNPKNIDKFADIARHDVKFVNRQRGSGTRYLIDFMRKKADISTESIDGYELELNTHMAIATAVKSGAADVGIGTYAAASSLELEFIPIGNENYDFLVRDSDLELSEVKDFIGILKSNKLRERLDQMGGYGFEGIGIIRKTEVGYDG